MKRVIGLALWFAVAAFAAEKTPLPKSLPVYGELKPVPSPRVTQIKLDNGLTVWLASKAGFPKVALSLAVRGGYGVDPPNRAGITALIASVMSQGTKTRTSRQIAEELQAAGGDVSAQGDADSIIVTTQVLSEKSDQALAILADLAQNAAFAESEVALAKRNAESRLTAREADPNFLAERALYRAMFASHPYAVTGPTHESIAASTAEDLRHEYAKRFRPDGALLVAIGNFNEGNLGAAVRAALGKWTAPKEEAPVRVVKPTQTVSHAVAYVPRPGSVQTEFLIGALSPERTDKDYAAMRVATALYGGMFGSRLMANIREDKGYTYSPFAFVNILRETGVLATGAAVRNEVTGASYNEIMYELNRMATTAPSEEELKRVKSYLIGSLAIRLQSQASVARSLAALWVAGLPPEEMGRQSLAVEQLKASDVEAAARKYLPAWRMSIVAVGEENVIKDQLSPFGLEFQKVQ